MARARVPGTTTSVGLHVVTPGSFDALGARLLAGRDFAPTDTVDSLPVAVLSESAAARLGPNPVGQRIRVAGGVSSEGPFEVVGVAADVPYDSLATAERPQVYVSYLQVRHGQAFLVVRTRASAGPVASAMRAHLAGDVLLKGAAIQDLGRMAETELSRMRSSVRLVGSAAALAIVLAGLGLFAVLSHVVQRARLEIGLRLAVGATSFQAAGLVIRSVLAIAIAGVASGLPLGFLLVRHLGGLLGGTVSADSGSILAASLATVSAALVAGAIPAYRAAHVDPIESLRQP